MPSAPPRSNAAADALACWIVAPGRAEIRAEVLPAPGPDEVLVRTLHSGVSRGTEAIVFRGEVPASEHRRMRAPFQAGDFPAPVKYGYASVGVVEAGPAGLVGRTVFCLYPHQTRYVVPAAAVHPLPDGVPPARAVLAANLETAINVLWDATPRLGDRIVVIGGGVVGLLVAWLAARLPGCDVELVDPRADRAPVAAALGARWSAPDDSLTPDGAADRTTDGTSAATTAGTTRRTADGTADRTIVGIADGSRRNAADPTPTTARDDADLVIHTSGHPDGLAAALRRAGTEATVVEASWYGATPVTLPLGEAFHARRLVLRSSQVGTLPAAQRARWDTRRRLGLALELLADPLLDRLVTGHAPFAELPAVLARLAAGPSATLCQCIDHPA